MRENSNSWSQHLFSGFPVFKSEIHAFIPFYYLTHIAVDF